MAFLPSSVLDLAGHISTQAPQPVQSSGAIWTVNFKPAKAGVLASTDLKVSGAPSAALGS